jgi:flavin reductase (DIM6/NTAB) family NADH-FMN oxidoreductase RutF/rubredoxin
MNGYIANTAFQVTAEPPKLAISCHKDNLSSEIILKSKAFSISVLEKETNPDLIGLFGYNSGKDKNKFAQTNYKLGKTGMPIVLDNTIAFFECEVVDVIDVGTHYMFIGQVVEAESLNEKEPITYAYYRNVKKGLAPKNAPTYVDKSKLDNEAKPAKEENKTDSQRFVCEVCSYVYDPEIGDENQNIPPGTPFAELPDDWVCPICAAAKSDFISEN